MKIVSLTLNPALDKSAAVDTLTPDRKLRCFDAQTDAGGGGINVSKGIKKLGGESIAVFPKAGFNGKIIEGLLNTAGITTKCLEVEGETRENFSITESRSNAQYRFTMPGAKLSVSEADACLELVAAEKPEWVIASGSLPPGLPETYYETLAVFCQEIGARLILDTSGPPLEAAASKGLFLLKPNLGELSSLVGVEKLEMNRVDDAAMEIIGRGKCTMVVVSMGAQGALLATKEGFEHIPAPIVHKKTTVGAGDSMVAGMVWALASGQSYREAVQMGVSCGSAATMRHGTELFAPEDVWPLLDWIKTYGERYRFTDF